MNNKNYFKDPYALPLPWVHSPFFPSLVEAGSFSKEEKEMLHQYHTDGYIVIDLGLSDQEIEAVVSDMKKAAADEETVYHADHFQYTESKRIFEMWKDSKAATEMCTNKKVMETLELLYGKEPYPFSTINFFKGTDQPSHSDVIHFHTYPAQWMCGVWIAFEDVDETNGSLLYYPGSHRWPLYEYDELGLPHPDEVENGEEENYRHYEEFLRQLIKQNNATPAIAKLKKGQALVWAANLLHGGCNVEGVTDFNKTRLTQANHYFFKGCEQYYHPMFTQKFKGSYASKWCNDDNNIQTFLQTGKVDMFGKTITLEKD